MRVVTPGALDEELMVTGVVTRVGIMSVLSRWPFGVAAASTQHR
jgi:hypothetical protein